jgi:hypothetical protein
LHAETATEEELIVVIAVELAATIFIAVLDAATAAMILDLLQHTVQKVLLPIALLILTTIALIEAVLLSINVIKVALLPNVVR